MALNFPNSPALNDVYIDTTSGFSYQWNGTVWISFSAASSSQIKVLDDISGSFTGIAFTFALTSSSASISPPNAQSLIINLGGVIQDPSDDYIVSGSNIIFSNAPNNGLSFSGVSLGPAIPVNTIPDGTVTGGSLTVAGILSTTNLFVSGISTFVGLATHTGTIFGSNLSLAGVATASTVSATNFNTTSDINLKENIKPIEDSLNKVLQLNGIEFDWKDNQQPSIGVIAQEVEKVFPSLVKTAKNKSVNYNGLIGVLIEAVKEQQKQIEELKKIIFYK
jgi:hypothetical protein